MYMYNVHVYHNAYSLVMRGYYVSPSLSLIFTTYTVAIEYEIWLQKKINDLVANLATTLSWLQESVLWIMSPPQFPLSPRN